MKVSPEDQEVIDVFKTEDKEERKAKFLNLGADKIWAFFKKENLYKLIRETNLND